MNRRRDHEEGLQEAEEDDQRDEDPELLFVISEEGLVDDLSGQPRNHEPGRLRRDGETDRDSERPLVGPQERQQPDERAEPRRLLRVCCHLVAECRHHWVQRRRCNVASRRAQSDVSGGALEIVGDVGDRVEQGGDDAGRSPRVAAADGDDLAAHRIGVDDMSRAEEPARQLLGHGRIREKRDSETLAHHLLRCVDVVELHDAARDHAVLAQERGRDVVVARRAVEEDEPLVTDARDLDLAGKGEACSGCVTSTSSSS